MTFKSEFEVFDEVYIILDSDIVKCSVREIKFPNPYRLNPNPSNDTIQYGLLKITDLHTFDSIQESNTFYKWRFANQMGRTAIELLDKLKESVINENIK